jgi:hypothetical protein
MSQRRQDARRAQQERRRQARHDTRATQKRPAPAPVAPRPSAAPPPRKTFWTTRNKWIIFGGIAGVIVIALAAWIIASVRAPLPGQKFESLGNDHLADINSPHEPYNSDPPTSGPHLPPIPRPGIYTQPKRAEELGHFMEHGGVWLLYNCPDGCEEDVQRLTEITNQAIDRNRPVALAPYPSMESRFAATAWQYLLTLDAVDRGELDNFINRHACRYNPEGGPYCSGVRGTVKEGSNQNPATATITPTSVFGTQTPVASPTATPGQ